MDRAKALFTKFYNLVYAKNEMKEFIHEVKKKLRTKSFYSLLGFVAILLFIFLANGLHESYPDEFDNILGGWNTLHGSFLYSSFFTHHGPTAYLIAAVLELFSGNSFFRFRIVYSISLLAFLLYSFWYFRRSLGAQLVQFFPLFLLFIGLGATYFWGHMLLADIVSGFLLTFAIGLVVIKRLHNKNLTAHDMIFVSILTSLSVLSSLTYLYLSVILYGYVFLEYFSSNKLSYLKIRNYFYPIIVFTIPFVILLIYLILTGSLSDYLYQNFTFNQQYYIYNYPRAPGETFINPVRFAIIIAHEFIMSFFDLLVQAKDLNFYFPFNIALAVGNTAFMIYAFASRKFKLLLFVFLMFIYSNGRSNPLTSGERDYQSSVYIMLSLFLTCYLLYELFEKLKSGLEYQKKLVYSLLFVITFIYAFANFSFLGRKFIDKVYQKYMGKAPLIYDRPQIAPIINMTLTKNDYTWIGPFEFEELFYTKIKNVSQYQIFNPGMGRSEKIQNGLIADFEKNKPKLIWFDKRFYILGENPEKYGRPFIAYINDHYTNIYDYRRGDSRFVSVKPIDQKTDIETKLYIRIENAEEIIDKLASLGVIREVSAR